MLELAHKQLNVYKMALGMLKNVYLQTKMFPVDEQFLLVTQLRKAAVSVCSNIAEGSSRASKLEKRRFYEIARSSVVEIECQLEISLMLQYMPPNSHMELNQVLESIFRMLSSMIRHLNGA